MTQAIVKQTLTQQIAQANQLEPSYVELVKNVYAKGATDDELALFLATAKRAGLDVTARQIFMVKRWDSKAKKEVATIQVSIDGFRLIADRTGCYAPSREPSYTYDKDGKLESATAHIKKFAGGVWHEVSATAFFEEYFQENNFIWKKMPRLMLAKTAEALVLRRAFPANLSGLYTDDEMGTVNKTEVETIPHAKPLPPVQLQPQPVNEKDEEIRLVCKKLNENENPLWTPKKVREFASDLFSAEISNVFELDNEKKQYLIDALNDELFAITENVIDAEAVEVPQKTDETTAEVPDDSTKSKLSTIDQIRLVEKELRELNVEVKSYNPTGKTIDDMKAELEALEEQLERKKKVGK